MNNAPSELRHARLIDDARGFTLIELLVDPDRRHPCRDRPAAFLNQRAKGEDTAAKAMLRTAAAALVPSLPTEYTYAATVPDLELIEPALDEARGC